MKITKLLAAASISGILIAGLATSPAFAWHPKGVIVKYVQNQTTGGAKTDANTDAEAVSAKPGDILKYTIEVRNDGAADSKGYNDMAKTVVTDTLPAGVELTEGAVRSGITFDLGTIKPGEKVTKEFTVKVASVTNGALIDNKACFTGNSTANDNPQAGCDDAKIKVTVPETPTPPKPPVVTPPVVTPPAPTLPETGASSFIVPALFASIGGYVAYFLHLKRKASN